MSYDLPIKPGGDVYYLTGAQEPIIMKGKCVGLDFRGGHIRIVADFGYALVGILTEVLGTRLFITEKEAQDELKKWI